MKSRETEIKRNDAFVHCRVCDQDGTRVGRSFAEIKRAILLSRILWDCQNNSAKPDTTARPTQIMLGSTNRFTAL